MEEQLTKTRRGLSGAVLKYIAMVSMLVDHGATAFEADMGEYFYWLHAFGRLAFPLFCFLLVEGSLHTSNMKEYLGAIGVFAVISEVPFDMVMSGQLHSIWSCNVMWTLGLGLLAIFIWQTLVEGNVPAKATSTVVIDWLIAALSIAGILILAYVIRTDYGAIGVALILALYIFRNQLIIRDLSAAALLVSLGRIEVFAIPAIALFHTYNGERGRQPKWLFYVFYPAHLLILGIIRMAY